MFAATLAVGLYLSAHAEPLAERLLREGSDHAAAKLLRQAEERFDLAVALAPNPAAALGCRALARQMRGKEQAAETDLGLATLSWLLVHDPDDTNLLRFRGLAWIDTDARRALADFDRLIELDPTEAWGWFGRAAAAEELDNLPLAEADLAEAVRLDPDFGLAHLLRGTVLISTGRPVAAWAALERAGDLDLETRGNRARLHFARGWLLAKAGRTDEARAEYDVGLRLRPRSFDALLKRTRAASQPPRWEEALAHVEHLLDEEPDDAAALLTKAKILGTLRRLREAQRTLEHLLEVEPGSVAGALELIAGLVEQKKLPGALAAAERLLGREPAESTALALRVCILDEMGQAEAAAAAYADAIALDPLNDELQYQFVRMEAKQGRHASAFQVACRLAARRPEVANYNFVAGQLALEQKAFSEAHELLTRTLERQPRNAEARRHRAACAIALAWHADALADADRLLRDNPKDVDALRVRFTVHRAQGRWKEALAAADELEKVWPEPTKIAVSRAECLLELGELEEAQRQIAFVQSFAANHENLPELVQKLKAKQQMAKTGGLPTANESAEPEGLRQTSFRGEEKPASATAKAASQEASFPWRDPAEEELNAKAKKLAETDFKEDGFQDRLAKLNEAAARAPGDPAALLRRADFFRDQGLPQRAIADYTAALALKPDERAAREARFRLLLRLGRLPEAEADFAYLVKREPGRRAALEQARRELTEAPSGPPTRP